MNKLSLYTTLTSHKKFMQIFAAISDLFYLVQEFLTTGECTLLFERKLDCPENNTDIEYKVSTV